MSGTQPSTESRPPEQPQDAVELNDMSSRTDAKAAAEAETGPSLPAKDEQPSLSSNRAGETEAKPDSTGSAAAAAAAAAEAKGKAKEDSSAVQTDRRRDGDDLSIEPTSPHKSSTDSPICTITLLLPTGARHPYKIDEKYLSKRGVEIPDETPTGQKDPFSISVYKLKELILREWREEWEARPASPTSIRLIHFGKLLEDKESLKSTTKKPRSGI